MAPTELSTVVVPLVVVGLESDEVSAVFNTKVKEQCYLSKTWKSIQRYWPFENLQNTLRIKSVRRSKATYTHTAVSGSASLLSHALHEPNCNWSRNHFVTFWQFDEWPSESKFLAHFQPVVSVTWLLIWTPFISSLFKWLSIFLNGNYMATYNVLTTVEYELILPIPLITSAKIYFHNNSFHFTEFNVQNVAPSFTISGQYQCWCLTAHVDWLTLCI